MMSNVSSIRQTPRKADPLRARLRSALAAQAETAAAVARQGRAILDTSTAKFAARRAAEKAKAEIDVAVAGHAEAIARAAAAGSAAPTSSGVRAARNREIDMLDQADALAAALEKLKTDLPELKRAEMLASAEVERCVVALFDQSAQNMLAKALALRAELDPLVGMLSSLFASGVGKVETEYGVPADVRSDALQDVHKKMMPLFARPDTPLDGEPWASARRSLIENPDADFELHLKRNAHGAGTSGNAT